MVQKTQKNDSTFYRSELHSYNWLLNINVMFQRERNVFVELVKKSALTIPSFNKQLLISWWWVCTIQRSFHMCHRSLAIHPCRPDIWISRKSESFQYFRTYDKRLKNLRWSTLFNLSALGAVNPWAVRITNCQNIHCLPFSFQSSKF